MTQTNLTDLAPARVPHLPLAPVGRLIRTLLAPAAWLARACGRALSEVVFAAGQSATMAYVDPFGQSRRNPPGPNPCRPDHQDPRI